MIEKNTNITKSKQLDRIVHSTDGWSQITIGDQRFYSKEGIYFPSVTYILSYYPKGKQFENWLKSVGEDADFVAQEAAERGTNVHRAIEKMLEGFEPTWIDESGFVNYSLDEWLMIVRFADFWNTYKPKLIKSEYHTFSNNHKFAGTIDLVIELNGELWVIDIKTSNSLHTVYELQTAAYVESWNEHNDNKVTKSGILWLRAKTRKPSSDPTKIQGRGWGLISSDRTQEENFSIFQKVYDIFRIEVPEAKPISEKYPNSIKLEFE
jgi:hypothetical protein